MMLKNLYLPIPGVILSVVLSVPGSVLAQSCGAGCGENIPAFLCGNGDTCDPGTLLRWHCQSPDAGVAGLDEGLVTDRPDFTEASSVVGRGVLQLELGYTYTHDDNAAGLSLIHI